MKAYKNGDDGVYSWNVAPKAGSIENLCLVRKDRATIALRVRKESLYVLEWVCIFVELFLFCIFHVDAPD